MRSAILRPLTLACGLLLALPPGWCCMARAWESPQQAESDTPCPPPDCCPCKGPAQPKAPTPRPAPLPPGQCPCDGRQSVAPDAPKAVGCDLSLPAPLPVIDLVPCRARGDGPVSLPVFSSDFSLHLRHCVWLC
jgi:hypothetical protein